METAESRARFATEDRDRQLAAMRARHGSELAKMTKERDEWRMRAEEAEARLSSMQWMGGKKKRAKKSVAENPKKSAETSHSHSVDTDQKWPSTDGYDPFLVYEMEPTPLDLLHSADEEEEEEEEEEEYDGDVACQWVYGEGTHESWTQTLEVERKPRHRYTVSEGIPVKAAETEKASDDGDKGKRRHTMSDAAMKDVTLQPKKPSAEVESSSGELGEDQEALIAELKSEIDFKQRKILDSGYAGAHVA
ncbi:hypothetical protein CYMTET_51936 [Cymbomonas tetramitiformis]|uniref:Uncharacterized protein n=1 Tax=Cymbomonas tetramitiformis TaxID=36881 RepID=A0AAE0BL70_9CHLO|nr:hypothetical protein CYMTET_51936 [Cymbomonas tetramitiformis]